MNSIKQKIRKRLRFLFTRNTYIFLLCVFIAMVFWLLTKLSKEYSTELELRVEYVNIPEQKVLRNKLPEKLTLTVKGSGWELLRQQLKLSSRPLHIDVHDFAKSGRMLTNNYRNLFESQLGDRLEIVRVSPSEIRFSFEKKSSRKLPVKLNGTIGIDPQYGIDGEIRIEPDSILVTGPASVVDTMTAVRTEALHFEQLNKTKEGSIALADPPLSGVSYESGEVRYLIPVVQYTETSLKVPVKIINADKEALLLTKEAELSFQLPLGKIDEIKGREASELFSVVADFSLVQAGDSTVPLIPVTAPPYIRNLKVKPGREAFLYINP